MSQDGSANHAQLPGPESVITGEPERLEPELACSVLALSVNVRRLIIVPQATRPASSVNASGREASNAAPGPLQRR